MFCESGRVRWALNLLETMNASAADFALGEAGDGQLDIQAWITRRPTLWSSAPEQFWTLALNVDQGSLGWAQPSASEAFLSSMTRCAPARWGDDRIDMHLEFDGDTGTDTLVVERRRRSDGVLLWSSRRQSDYESNGYCQLAISGSQLYLSISEWSALPQLLAWQADGQVRWERQLMPAHPVQMIATTGDDVIVAHVDAPLNMPTQHILSRLRAADGAQQWESTVPADLLVMRADGPAFDIAWASHTTSSPSALLERRDATNGATLAQSQAAVLGFKAAPVATIAWDAHACSAEVGINQLSRIDLRCLDADSGAPIWSSSMPLLDPGESISALEWSRLGDSRLLLRASTPIPTPQGSYPRHRLFALDALSGSLHWQSTQLGGLSLLAGGDGAVYMVDADCSAPPNCSSSPYLLRKLDGSTGAELWQRQFGLSPLAAGAGLVVGWRQDSGLRGFEALDAGTGGPRWAHPIASAGLLSPAAMVTAGGEVIVKHEPSVGALRNVDVRRLDIDTGATLYVLSPSIPTARTELAVLGESAAGDLLVTAARDTGAWLARALLANGVPVWESNPAAPAGETRWVRFAGARPTGQWAYQIRRRDAWIERRALSRVDTVDGTLGGEHLYAVAVPGEGTAFASVTLLAVAADGTSLVTDARGGTLAQVRTRLQSWSAPADVLGDVSLQVLGPAPGTGLGADTRVTLLVANDSPQPTNHLLVRADSESSTLWFRLLDCLPADVCTQIDGADEAQLSMAAHSTATLIFEVHDPGYRPDARLGTDTALFRVDTPFDFGDLDLGNNAVSVPVRLGGMRGGFE